MICLSLPGRKSKQTRWPPPRRQDCHLSSSGKHHLHRFCYHLLMQDDFICYWKEGKDLFQQNGSSTRLNSKRCFRTSLTFVEIPSFWCNELCQLINSIIYMGMQHNSEYQHPPPLVINYNFFCLLLYRKVRVQGKLSRGVLREGRKTVVSFHEEDHPTCMTC